MQIRTLQELFFGYQNNFWIIYGKQLWALFSVGCLWTCGSV